MKYGGHYAACKLTSVELTPIGWPKESMLRFLLFGFVSLRKASVS
jgi:hypothetical protein